MTSRILNETEGSVRLVPTKTHPFTSMALNSSRSNSLKHSGNGEININLDVKACVKLQPRILRTIINMQNSILRDQLRVVLINFIFSSHL